MSRDRQVVKREALVVAHQGEDVQTLVNQILADPAFASLRLEQDPGASPPDGIALVRAKNWTEQDEAGPGLAQRLDPHPVEPNYAIVVMTHGRVLPISYPRPGAGVLPNLGHSNVVVLIVDFALVTPSPLNGTVDGPVQALKDPGATSVAELHATFVAGIIRHQEPRAVIRVMRLANPNDDGFVSDWELANQLVHVARSKGLPDIINLSLGTLADPDEEPVAIKAAITELLDRGVHVFAAAGNDGNDLGPVFPAAFPSVHSVGAQTFDAGVARPADFSNRGDPDGVDFWAPGVSVLSTTVDSPQSISFSEGHDPTNNFKDLPPSQQENVSLNGWACWDGTSFATPVLAAACATELIDRPDANPIPALRDLYGAHDNATGFTGNKPVQRCEESIPSGA